MTTIPKEEEIISPGVRKTMQDERNDEWYSNTRPNRTGSRKKKGRKKKGTCQLPCPNPKPPQQATHQQSIPPALIGKSSPRVPTISQEESLTSSTPSPGRYKHSLPSFQRPKGASFLSQEV